MSLGLEVPRNLSSMLSLLENKKGASAPMSYECGLLDSSNLVDGGWVEPGLRVYVERGSNGSSEKGLISVDVVTCNGGETPKQAMDSQSALDLQRRLQLHKPDEFRVLALAGYLENMAMLQVEILYRVPEWASAPYAPTSLFRLAAEGQLPTLVSTRIAIARKLACAVLHFHASNWIHGNIIDRNIIFFTPRGTQSGSPNLLEPFFCGFAPHPVETSSYLLRARTQDIYQLAWVILKLVFGDEVVHELRIFEPVRPLTTSTLEGIIAKSALRSMKQTKAVSLFTDAVMSCIFGSAAREGIIVQDKEFGKLAGFYWQVVRPLDHCLSLLEDPRPSVVAQGGHVRRRMSVQLPPTFPETCLDS